VINLLSIIVIKQLFYYYDNSKFLDTTVLNDTKQTRMLV